MALAVQCPGCRSRLGVLESAIGTKVECPKCHKMVQVPGGKDEEFEVVDEDIEVVDDDIEVVEEDDFEVVDDEPKKAPKKDKASSNGKPKKKARVVVADDDDDEDEDYDERPKKKKGKKKAPPPKSNMPLMIGVGALVLIVAVVGAVFAFKGGGNSKDKTTSGDKWVQYDAPDGSFTAYFPGGTPTSGDLSVLEPNATPQQKEQIKSVMTMLKMKVDIWVRDADSRKYMVMVMEVPPEMASQLKPEELTKPARQGGGFGMPGMPGMQKSQLLSDETTTVSGQTAKQILAKQDSKYSFMRVFFSGNRAVILMVMNDGELKTDDKDSLNYFGKFQWKK